MLLRQESFRTLSLSACLSLGALWACTETLPPASEQKEKEDEELDDGLGGASAECDDDSCDPPPLTTPAGCRSVSCETGTECEVNTSAEGYTCVEVDGCVGALCGAGTVCADVPAPGTGYECVETEVDPTRCSAASCGAGFVCFQLAGGAGFECLDPNELSETETSCAEVVCPEGSTCWDAIAPSVGWECVANTTCAEATCADGETCVDAEPPETGYECVAAGGFKSNMPLATVSIEPFNLSSTGLTVISSNLLSQPSGSQWYEQWFAVLANEGTSTLCYAQAEVDFLRAGVIVAEHYGYADAAPHGVTGDSSNPCIAAGEVGVVYSNGFADANVNAAGADEIQIIVVGTESTDPRHPHEPTLTSMATENWTVAGTATAKATIYNIGLDAYAYDSAGLVFERRSALHLETFYSGATWDYETLSFGAAFTQYEAYIDFLPGAGSRRVGAAPLGWEELARLREDRDARDTVLRENQLAAQAAQ